MISQRHIHSQPFQQQQPPSFQDLLAMLQLQGQQQHQQMQAAQAAQQMEMDAAKPGQAQQMMILDALTKGQNQLGAMSPHVLDYLKQQFNYNPSPGITDQQSMGLPGVDFTGMGMAQ